MEYEQQIDELINSCNLTNWRLALEICRGLEIEDAELIIGTKCHGILAYILHLTLDKYWKFIEIDCNCEWYINRESGMEIIIEHNLTKNIMISKYYEYRHIIELEERNKL